MTDKIVGKAIYIELVPKTAKEAGQNLVTQILVTPEGFDEKSNYVPMAVHSRTVSEWSPRKQWRISLSRVNNKELFGTPIAQTTAQEKAVEMVAQIESVIKRQIAYEMELRKTPIVAEVSTIDLAEVKDWKTPSALLRRIQKARVALNFPEKVL
jgi:hypothetical protein